MKYIEYILHLYSESHGRLDPHVGGSRGLPASRLKGLANVARSKSGLGIGHQGSNAAGERHARLHVSILERDPLPCYRKHPSPDKHQHVWATASKSIGTNTTSSLGIDLDG